MHKQCSFGFCPGVCQGDVRDCQERRLLQIVHEKHNQGLFIASNKFGYFVLLFDDIHLLTMHLVQFLFV